MIDLFSLRETHTHHVLSLCQGAMQLIRPSGSLRRTADAQCSLRAARTHTPPNAFVPRMEGSLVTSALAALFVFARAIRAENPLGQSKRAADIQIVISKMKLARRFVESSPKIPQNLPSLK